MSGLESGAPSAGPSPPESGAGGSSPSASGVAPPRARRAGCRRAVLALALLAGALLLGRGPILRGLPRALVAQDPEEPADAIVVLAGDAGERVEQGVRLWKRGFSRSGLFVLSGGPVYHRTTFAELMARHAEELGVPRERLLEQRVSRTTVEDARATLDLLLARGDVKSIVLVTSAWHSRRAKAAFVAASAGRVRVVSLPAPAPELETEWWRDAPATRSIVTELLKYLW